MNNFCNFFFLLAFIIDDRQMMGERLNDLSFEEVLTLDQEMEAAVQVVRERKVRCTIFFFVCVLMVT